MTISLRNSKLGHILNFGHFQCSPTPNCLQYCYAKRGHYLHPSVRMRLRKNYELSQQDDFVKLIFHQIYPYYNLGMAYFRIHHAGDFYSQEYYDKWVEIARLLPRMKFLAYTRNYKLKLYDPDLHNNNMILYYSIDDSTEVPIEETPFRLWARADEGHYKGDIQDKSFNIDGSMNCSQGKCMMCLICWEGRINITFPMRYKCDIKVT